jgi:hypothetical protein
VRYIHIVLLRVDLFLRYTKQSEVKEVNFIVLYILIYALDGILEDKGS